MARKKVVLEKKPEVVIPEKKSILDEIVWMRKGHQGRYSALKDVGVSIINHKASEKRNRQAYVTISFSFRNRIEKVFKSDYVEFGAVKNRIYFRPSDKRNGYKITIKANTAYVQATLLSDEIKKTYSDFDKSEYHLKYDDFQELYYIEREK